jgi:pimeloyl-ACP methyl ester carboxylesterase
LHQGFENEEDAMAELVRDGVRLVYEDVGRGDPPMLFVHGWSCRRSHFAPQVAQFSSSRRCISVDLRGHGDSDAPEQDYTIDGFADDIAWIADRLGVRGALLVGHSMGGAVVLAVAAARPDLAAAVAMCDPAILFPANLQVMAAQLAAAFGAPGGMATLEQFAAGQFFTASTDPTLKKDVLAEMLRTPQHVSASAFTAIATFGGESALRAVNAPLMYIGAEPEISDVARLRELKPDAMIARTGGAGHFHQLEVPDQINAMLERFLRVAAGK